MADIPNRLAARVSNRLAADIARFISNWESVPPYTDGPADECRSCTHRTREITSRPLTTDANLDPPLK